MIIAITGLVAKLKEMISDAAHILTVFAVLGEKLAVLKVRLVILNLGFANMLTAHLLLHST